jgi:hypothetical protein
MRSVYELFKLKPHVFTTDQGSNYIAAIDSLRIKRLTCVAHNLNLVVTDLFSDTKIRSADGKDGDCLRSFKSLVDKARAIAKWTSLSVLRTAALFQAQQALKVWSRGID